LWDRIPLLLYHRIKDDRDLMRRRRGGPCRTQFAFHPSQVVAQRRFLPLERIRSQDSLPDFRHQCRLTAQLPDFVLTFLILWLSAGIRGSA
jgi:hypothetical protein